jgi:hypothetical protein
MWHMLAELTGRTLEPLESHGTVRPQDGRRQRDLNDVGQPTWSYMWAYTKTSMTVVQRLIAAGDLSRPTSIDSSVIQKALLRAEIRRLAIA